MVTGRLFFGLTEELFGVSKNGEPAQKIHVDVSENGGTQ